jgi:signal transduction histidine kinase
VTEQKQVEQHRARLIREQVACAEGGAKHSDEALHFLAEASKTLGRSLDSEEMLCSLAHLAIPFLADCCTAYTTEGNLIRRVAEAHIDPVQEKMFHQLDRECFASPFLENHPLLEVMRTGQLEVREEAQDWELLIAFQDVKHLEARLRPHSVLLLPILGRKRVLGAIGLAFSEQLRRYGWREVTVAEELARHAALIIENASLFRQARKANRLKDEFLTTVSHELRTPLCAIVGWSQLLRSKNLNSQTVAHAYAVIERNARVQTHLIEDLLDLSRIVSGKLHLNVGTTDLAPIVLAAVDSVSVAAESKGIRIQTFCEPMTGPVLGDAGRLQQVVWNLLSNALKFTPRGGLVQAHLIAGGTNSEIRVSDTGQGIRPDFLPYVFDQFCQADGSPSRKHGGLGIGLATVQHLVESHGGTVEAFSEGLGKGATFTVKLPSLPTRTGDTGRRLTRPAERSG